MPPELILTEPTTCKQYQTKYTKIVWVEIPEHPRLSYAEQGEALFLKYYKNYVMTTWQAIDRIITVKNGSCGKIQKPNPAEVKRVIRAVCPDPVTRHKYDCVKMFVRLVEEGK